MLDELRDLFLAALKFEGNDAMPLVNRWNEAVKRVQAVFDNMTSKTVDAAPVVRCRECQYGEYDDTIEDEYCYHCTYGGFPYNKADHFCSDGERKRGGS